MGQDGWETGGGERWSTGTAADTMAWVDGTSRDPKRIQLAEDQEKQTRLTNHPDERERPIQTKQSMMV